MDTKALVTAACEAALIAAAANTRKDLLRDAVAAVCTASGTDRSKTPLGEVRLDGGAGEPVAYIADDAAYASWVAQRHPQEVTATVTVPADQLEAVLALLDGAGVAGVTAQVTPTRDGLRHLASAALVEDGEDGWFGVSPDGETIDGVAGRRPGGTWKVVPVRSRLVEAKVAAEESTRAEIAALEARTPRAAVGGVAA